MPRKTLDGRDASVRRRSEGAGRECSRTDPATATGNDLAMRAPEKASQTNHTARSKGRPGDADNPEHRVATSSMPGDSRAGHGQPQRAPNHHATASSRNRRGRAAAIARPASARYRAPGPQQSCEDERRERTAGPFLGRRHGASRLSAMSRFENPPSCGGDRQACECALSSTRARRSCGYERRVTPCSAPASLPP